MESINLPTAAKQEEILTNVSGAKTTLDVINTNINRGFIKSIQRGYVSVSASSLQSITISPVDPNKSIVLLNSAFSSGSTAAISSTGVSIYSFSSTTLKLWIMGPTSGTGQTGETYCTWQIIEFY